jgi:hypothetical protein
MAAANVHHEIKSGKKKTGAEKTAPVGIKF